MIGHLEGEILHPDGVTKPYFSPTIPFDAAQEIVNALQRMFPLSQLYVAFHFDPLAVKPN